MRITVTGVVPPQRPLQPCGVPPAEDARAPARPDCDAGARRERPLIDFAVALVVLAPGLPSDEPDLGVRAGSAVSVVAAAVLLLRRSKPLPVLAMTGVLAAWQVALDLPSASLAAVLVALWTVAERRERRVALPCGRGRGASRGPARDLRGAGPA